MIHKYFKINFILVLTGVLTFTSCGTSREFTSRDVQELDDILQDHYFEIEAEWARPLVTNALIQVGNAGLFAPGDNASQINLQGRTSYFKFEGDTVTADLPYYGERQMGGGYNEDSGIEFEGKPQELETIKDKDENRYIMSFSISEDTETFRIRLTFYPNRKAVINITSSHRNQISYRGKLKDVEFPKE